MMRVSPERIIAAPMFSFGLIHPDANLVSTFRHGRYPERTRQATPPLANIATTDRWPRTR